MLLVERDKFSQPTDSTSVDYCTPRTRKLWDFRGRVSPVKTMAVGDGCMDNCPDHEDSLVALYCETCQELICTKCISRGTLGKAPHKDHLYLDLMEAYDIQKEEFEKVVASLKMDLNDLRSRRQEAHSRLQKLQIELLRKKTQTEKKVRSVRDLILKKEREYLKRMDATYEPAIQRNDTAHTEIDFLLVSLEGALNSAESIQELPPKHCVSFLKNSLKLRKDIDKYKNQMHSEQGSKSSPKKENAKHPSPVCFRSLTLEKEKKSLSQAFDVPEAEPSKPHLLSSWSTIGRNSASLCWKYRKDEQISAFLIQYRPLMAAEALDQRLLESQQTQTSHSNNQTEFHSFKIRKFIGGRVQVSLRNLEENDWYLVKATAINAKGKSDTGIVAFKVTAQSSRATLITDDSKLPSYKAPSLLTRLQPAILLLLLVGIFWVSLPYVQDVFYEWTCRNFLMHLVVSMDMDGEEYDRDEPETESVLSWLL